MTLSAGFHAFINHWHPVYEGMHHDGREVKVVLSSWNAEGKFGSGEIYPFLIPSMYHGASHEGCFELRDNVIHFTADDYSEASVLSLRVSDDFTSLSIIDRLSKNVLGILHKMDSHPLLGRHD